MKNKKKWYPFLLVGLSILLMSSVAACGGTTDTSTTTPVSGNGSSSPPPPPPELEIRGATSFYGELDFYHVVGEIFNTTDYNIDFVKIVATFYNQAGTVIGTDFTYAELDIILPGEAAPFDISSYPNKIQPASYNLVSEYRSISEQPFAGLNIKSHSSHIGSLGYYEIVGEVQNTSTKSADFVKIVATFYNAGGEVIGTDFTYTDISVVGPGSTAPFELSSYPREISPASYKLQVQGQET